MASITEESPAVYPSGIYQIEDGDPATGGPSGITVLPSKQLADRTKYLKAQIDAILAELALSAVMGPEMALAALPYPEIATDTHKLAVGAGSVTNGGKVTVAAGQRLNLGMQTDTGVGRLGAWVTEAWESDDLDVSSTYYLRAQIDGGDLLLYTTEGADDDSIPVGLLGTPDSASGGGFDSTQIDILLAKVVTSTSGTVPTVTPLANAARLDLIAEVLCDGATDVYTALDWDDLTAADYTLDWARTPQAAPYLGGYGGTAGQPGGTTLNPGGAGDSTQVPKVVMVRGKSTCDRYALHAEYAYQDSSGDNGTISIVWTAHA